MRIVILGAPGSGKRTQTALVAEKYGLSSVMTGDLIKNAVLAQSPLGIEIKELQDAGRVVTEDIILALLREQLLTPELKEGFILDGFPRNLLQALTLDELMIEIEQPLDLILLIDIETDTLMERLVGRRTCRSCGLLYNIYRNPTVVDGVCDACGGRLHLRSDDNEETVSSRYHVFDHLISPLITHYEKQGKLVRINGNGEINQVFQLICEAIAGGSQAEAPIEPQRVPESPVEKQDESQVVEEVNPGSGDAGAASVSDAASRIVENSHDPSEVAKKVTGQKAVANPAAKKQAAKKKRVGKKAVKKEITGKKTSKKISTKKKASKKKVSVGKDASKKKLSTKKKTAKSSSKSKAKNKTGGPGKSGGKSVKSSRTSPRQSAKAVRKSPTKKAKKGIAVKGAVKKKGAKKKVKKTR